MNPIEIFRFLTDLLQNRAEVFAAFLTGVFFTIAAVWFFRHLVLRVREHPALSDVRQQLQNEQAKASTLNRLVDERDAKIIQLSQACEDSKEDLAEATTLLQQTKQKLNEWKVYAGELKKKATSAVHRWQEQAETLMHQLQDVEKLQGKIWEKPVKLTVPRFRPLAERHASIIAMFNLKGGVGKTSLTAHLGAMLWKLGKKVLLVDLDYQASLTHLVMPFAQIKDLHAGSRTAQRILAPSSQLPQEVWNALSALGSTGSYVLPAHEDLARAEEMSKAEWLTNPTKGEPRFALRSVLHDDLFQKFDYVLIDCPPRLSMACINALTASDFLLIPTSFDRTSRDAVGRLLDLVRRLNKACPDLRMLGVIGNMAHRGTGLTAREKTGWDMVMRDARDAWHGPVHGFARHIPRLVAFAEAADARILADQRADLGAWFAELVEEMEEQIQRRSRHAEGAGSAALR